eukprot:1724731-Lingulodinium_polyedra.AAC.1
MPLLAAAAPQQLRATACRGHSHPTGPAYCSRRTRRATQQAGLKRLPPSGPLPPKPPVRYSRRTRK